MICPCQNLLHYKGCTAEADELAGQIEWLKSLQETLPMLPENEDAHNALAAAIKRLTAIRAAASSARA
jgi:hypothetical protein